MVSDEELKTRVELVERERSVPDPELAGRLDEMESTARCVHNELARRIERVDESTADGAALADLADRLEGIEVRLDDLESRLD
jgi:tetrahydromethanopterin S-methyltransferase subunit G